MSETRSYYCDRCSQTVESANHICVNIPPADRHGTSFQRERWMEARLALAERMAEALERVEYVPELYDDGMRYECPDCGYSRGNGHGAECGIGAVLSEWRQKKGETK